VSEAREQNMCEKRGIETLFPNDIFSIHKYKDVDGWSVTFVPHFFICDLYHFDINLSLKYSQPLKKIFKIIVYLYKYLIEALFC
jgi:hypothetical protein